MRGRKLRARTPPPPPPNDIERALAAQERHRVLIYFSLKF